MAVCVPLETHTTTPVVGDLGQGLSARYTLGGGLIHSEGRSEESRCRA